MWTQKKIHNLVLQQKEYFKTGETLDVGFRIQQLNKLKEALKIYENDILEALKLDLGRSYEEGYLCDIGPVIMEINEYIRGVRKWSKPDFCFSGFVCFPSIFTKVYKMPYGTTLIISPFNFPFMLSLGVLAASISAGNTAILKASSKSKYSTKVLQKIINNTFDSKYVAVVDGGHDIADLCLDENFDKIFYTGSPNVGKHVMEKASKNLTPVALELGGENGNWCIIRKDADIKDAARKIAFFKALNAGQICININQIAVDEEIAEKFVNELVFAFNNQLGNDALLNDEYPKLINEAAYEKCEKEVEKYRDRVFFGGKGNKKTLKYAPTIIYPVGINEDIVKHELFNPILPIVPYKEKDLNKVLDIIDSREHPLAMYIFTKDIVWSNMIMSTRQYGGGCINEVCIHMMAKGAPFNGTGHSGMGAYHGKYGFNEFSHPCSVLKGYTKFNLSLREHPFYNNKWKSKLIKFFEK